MYFGSVDLRQRVNFDLDKVLLQVNFDLDEISYIDQVNFTAIKP